MVCNCLLSEMCKTHCSALNNGRECSRFPCRVCLFSNFDNCHATLTNTYKIMKWQLSRAINQREQGVKRNPKEKCGHCEKAGFVNLSVPMLSNEATNQYWVSIQTASFSRDDPTYCTQCCYMCWIYHFLWKKSKKETKKFYDCLIPVTLQKGV